MNQSENDSGDTGNRSAQAKTRYDNKFTIRKLEMEVIREQKNLITEERYKVGDTRRDRKDQALLGEIPRITFSKRK